MKTTKSALALAVLGLSLTATSVSAGQTTVTAADDSKPTRLCMAAANDQQLAMFVKVKRTGWSLKFVRDNVYCNGDTIGNFVAKHGSDGVKNLFPANPGVKIIDLASIQYNGQVTLSK